MIELVYPHIKTHKREASPSETFYRTMKKYSSCRDVATAARALSFRSSLAHHFFASGKKCQNVMFLDKKHDVFGQKVRNSGLFMCTPDYFREIRTLHPAVRGFRRLESEVRNGSWDPDLFPDLVDLWYTGRFVARAHQRERELLQ